jgi:hypothetical protein
MTKTGDMLNVQRDAMKLPKGKFCSDCRHFSFCQNFVGARSYWDQCDWSPSRFSHRVDLTIIVAQEDAL